jgi:hypothetical protein
MPARRDPQHPEAATYRGGGLQIEERFRFIDRRVGDLRRNSMLRPGRSTRLSAVATAISSFRMDASA